MREAAAGGHSGLGGGQAIYPINTSQTHKFSSAGLLPGPAPTLTHAKPSPSHKNLLFTMRRGGAESTALESSGNPSLAHDQPQDPRLHFSSSCLLIYRTASVLSASHAELSQGCVPGHLKVSGMSGEYLIFSRGWEGSDHCVICGIYVILFVHWSLPKGSYYGLQEHCIFFSTRIVFIHESALCV